MPLHVTVVDDHSAVRLGMKYIIRDWMPEAAVSFAENMPELLRLLSSKFIHIIVLDINIPGGNHFDMIKMIRDIQANVRILVLSAYEELLYALRYIDLGADGYLQKDSREDEIKEALNTVFRGKKYLSDDVKEHLLQRRLNHGILSGDNPLQRLTNRELEVCQLLVQGKGVTEISKALFIHTSTVGTYKGKIYEKLNVINIRELMDKFNFHHIGAGQK
ncbi:response regulator transcription factor [Parapedobacter defluvii]|uniref:response regulator transcription factor n=1 Tax=Parapedobacter defluvii TaxID=2045106 RepID=UPI00333F26E2